MLEKGQKSLCVSASWWLNILNLDEPTRLSNSALTRSHSPHSVRFSTDVLGIVHNQGNLNSNFDLSAGIHRAVMPMPLTLGHQQKKKR